MGPVTTKTKPGLEVWNFHSYLAPSSREGRGAGSGINDSSYLHDKVSIKSQQKGVQRAFGLVDTPTPGE